MKNKKKTLLMSLAAVLLVAAGVFGTLAFLTAKTDPVVNTFTVGNIDLTLTEDATDFKMVPGNSIVKDPIVTVKEGSEDSWVFVKVDKSENLDSFITYKIAKGWTKLKGSDNPNGDGVWYREVDTLETDQELKVLFDNKVTVRDSVTKKMMDEIDDKGNTAKEPTLTFIAYAVQKDNVDSAEDAWAKVPTEQK